jgi:hypothetical protein
VFNERNEIKNCGEDEYLEESEKKRVEGLRQPGGSSKDAIVTDLSMADYYTKSDTCNVLLAFLRCR